MHRFPNKEESLDQLTTQVRKVIRAATQTMIPGVSRQQESQGPQVE